MEGTLLRKVLGVRRFHCPEDLPGRKAKGTGGRRNKTEGSFRSLARPGHSHEGSQQLGGLLWAVTLGKSIKNRSLRSLWKGWLATLAVAERS